MEITIKGTKQEVDIAFKKIISSAYTGCIFGEKCDNCANCSFVKKEIIRWRAGEGETYYCILFLAEEMTIETREEHFSPRDDLRFFRGNYFQEKIQALDAVERIKDVFRKGGDI